MSPIRIRTAVPRLTIPPLDARQKGRTVRIGGLSLQELATRTGLSLGYVSRLFAGHRSSRTSTLVTIADALGVSLDDLHDAFAAVQRTRQTLTSKEQETRHDTHTQRQGASRARRRAHTRGRARTAAR